MQKINITIPKHRQKVRIIANPDLMQYELNSIRLEKERFEIKKSLEQDSYSERRRKEISEQLKGLGKYQKDDEEAHIEEKEPPTYYRAIRFANYQDPVELSLDKVKEDTVPLDIAAREIQKAYENGLHDGQLTARATYRTELQKYKDWINRIDSVVENLTQSHKSEIQKMHSNLVELSTMIAEYILLEEVKRDRSAILNIVEEAIKGLETEKVFAIFLHPDDIDIVRAARGKLLKDLTDSLNISIMPDSTLTPGGVLLETSAGIVDGRISTKLRNIQASLFEEDEREDLSMDVEKELSQLYKEQMLVSSKHSRMSEGIEQIERLKIEDPELYQQLVESGDIEVEEDDSEITDEVKKIKAQEHHKKMAEEYGEEMDWDEDRLEEFDKRIEAEADGEEEKNDQPDEIDESINKGIDDIEGVEGRDKDE